MIARSYIAAANTEGLYLDSVPLADIDQATWDALPAWLQHSVDACGFYAVPPAGAPPEAVALSVEETPPSPRKSRGT